MENGHFHHRKNGDFQSQLGQDKFLDEQIFKGKENGIFVEVGALDGIGASNTYFFEKNRNWSGILIEPNPFEFGRMLNSKRKANLENCAISEKEGIVEFLSITGPCNVLSGILDYYDPRHINRIKYELNMYKDYPPEHEFYSTSKVDQINAYRLQTLFDKYNYTQVDFCSIDVEGAEMSVLKSIDFDKTNITCIMLENNFGIDKETEFLISKGYRVYTNLQWDVLFIKNDFII